MANTNLWIMSGAPGCGKSYFAKNTLMTDESWKYISRDEVRYALVKENEEYFSKEKQVFYEFCTQIINAIKNKNVHNIIIDATHLNTSSRMKILNIINTVTKNINVFCVYFNTPLNICIARNKNRKGRTCVPEDALVRMYKSRSHPSKDGYKYAGIMEVSGL